MQQSALPTTAWIAMCSLLLLAPLVSQPVYAESACKGLEQAVCESNTLCRWQNGYTRKDGVQVKSHCRALPKKHEAVVAPAKTGAPPATTDAPSESMKTEKTSTP